MKKKKIVLAGPPRSGKSCLREGLKQALRAIPCIATDESERAKQKKILSR